MTGCHKSFVKMTKSEKSQFSLLKSETLQII